jgi:hypothetical protein
MYHQVYFIADAAAKRVKIGYSAEPVERAQRLAAMNASQLTLLAYAPGARKREHALHVAFAEFHAHGEWFNLAHMQPRLDLLLAHGLLAVGYELTQFWSAHQIVRLYK